MENRRGDKIIEIEGYMNNLKDFSPPSFEEYMFDIKTNAACERVFEKIVEAVIDLVILTIKENNLGTPMSDREALTLLSEKNVISSVLSDKLCDAKSMRNIIVHEYGYIDDEKVFYFIKNEILGDVKEFVEAVR